MVATYRKSGSAAAQVWILGGGRFGRQAMNVMRRQPFPAALTLVDTREVAGLPSGLEVVRGDAVDWLVDHLPEASGTVWIIPAVPVHLAVEWLKRSIVSAGGTVQPVAMQETMLQFFPHPYRLASSQLAVSHADFLCPPNCMEPEELCTYTKKPRPEPLYSLLQRVGGGFTPVIVRSRQFGSGVGGYFPEDLQMLYKRAVSQPNIPLLIGTACKCHGIVDGLMVG